MPKLIEKVAWAYSDHVQVNKIYNSSKLRIFVINGFEHNWDLIPNFKNQDFVFVIIPNHTTEWNFSFARDVLAQLNRNFNPFNIIFLCNYEEQYVWAKKNEFNAIIFNNNSTINENIFTISADESLRPFKMIINTRPENWKRPNLAEKIKPLAVIKGFNFRNDDYYDLSQLTPIYMNETRLAPEQVSEKYNFAMVGGCFSAAEGACLASSEMLLCGLPVISTHSEGGRSFWYTNRNSIVVDAKPELIAEAADRAIFNIKNGIWFRDEIREVHIAMARIQRNRFIQLLRNILTSQSLQDTSLDIFQKSCSDVNMNIKQIHTKNISMLF